ncbi:MAG: hypothetical protein IJL32_04110 [Oscillospiraceae bacterium]|nr:hypothetical protein [Oscillospiraceae bacterium]
MKIEPRKTASLPKYAMLLAASATLLTGCARNLAGGGPDLAGEATIAPDQNVIDNSDNDPLQLEGEAISLTDAVAEQSEEQLTEGFARQGITLERANESAAYHGDCWQTWFVDQNNAVTVSFYFDSTWDKEIFTEQGAAEFSWGYADKTQYPLGAEEQTDCRTAFIAVSMARDDAITADEAEQIAKDLLSVLPADTEQAQAEESEFAQIEETEVQTDEN